MDDYKLKYLSEIETNIRKAFGKPFYIFNTLRNHNSNEFELAKR